jgi:medium-chain acyl-[acyl-carrier-protein] hydrolase
MKTISSFNSWVTCPKPNPQAKLRLFCFHYAGGGASSFRTWIDSLPPYIEVCPLELPGRGFRIFETPFSHLEPLIQELVQTLLPNLTKPFVFFGHSMGALISFETIQLLRRQHRLSPLQLFVSGQRAPHLSASEPPIHALPESAFIKELRRYNGTPEEVLNNRELMELLLPTLRADFSLIETHIYTPSAPLDFPINVFGGLKDWTVSYNELEAWQEQTKADFALQMFPGDHFFLHSAETLLLPVVSQKLQEIVQDLS